MNMGDGGSSQPKMEENLYHKKRSEAYALVS
jgi:hypothetical protein